MKRKFMKFINNGSLKVIPYPTYFKQRFYHLCFISWIGSVATIIVTLFYVCVTVHH